jgi:hypothetical protein
MTFDLTSVLAPALFTLVALFAAATAALVAGSIVARAPRPGLERKRGRRPRTAVRAVGRTPARGSA